VTNLEYTTAAGDTLTQLENAVNALLRQGWIPQGGIAVVAYVDNDRNGFPQVNKEYFQALVREKSEN
jgi:hypothetical protein